MPADRRILRQRILLEEVAQAFPHVVGEPAQLRPGEQVALQLLGALGVFGRIAQLLDEADDEAVELVPQRMVLVGQHLVEQRAGRCDDLLQQIGVGAEQVEQRRQLVADLFAHGLQRRLVVEEFAERADQPVEQFLVAAVVGEGGEQLGGERRDAHLADLVEHALGDEIAQAGLLDRRHRLRHQPADEAGQAAGPPGIGQPVGDECGEIDLVRACRGPVPAPGN